MSDFKICPAGGKILMPKLWLIDMDDTLYSASAKMFHEIHVLMDQYIIKHLALSPDQANMLRKEYWRRYGVTYYGLWLHHGIDPHHFLTETHKVDVSSIHTQSCMKQAIFDLPGEKVLFTNAHNVFADQVLAKLHLQNCFTKQYRAEDMKVFGQWRPKPSAQMFRKIVAEHHLQAHQCCLIDDNLFNLKVAKSVGLQTVLCKGWHHHKFNVIRQSLYVDAFISHIKDIQKILLEKKQARVKRHRPQFLNPYN